MPPPNFDAYPRRLQTAARRVDTDATPAQREAMNARVGHLHLHGLDLAIEYPKDSVRRGVSADGTPWSRVMAAHYGRIKRTTGVDGDPVDVYLGEHPQSQLVFVVNQLDADGNLDEHKVVLGTRNHQEARRLYLAHYPRGWEETRLGEVRGFFMPAFKKWLARGGYVKNRSGRAKAAACGPHATLVADARKALGRFTATELDGIYVYANPLLGEAHLDVCDWGVPKVGDRVEAALRGLVGEGHLTRVNEGAKPPARDGWVRVEARAEKRADDAPAAGGVDFTRLARLRAALVRP